MLQPGLRSGLVNPTLGGGGGLEVGLRSASGT